MRLEPSTPTRGSTGADAAGVLELLHRLVQGLSLYSSDHPSVTAASRELASSIDRTIGGEGGLSLGVAPDHFLAEGEELRSVPLGLLAAMLNRLDIGGVEFRAGATPDHMVALACIVSDAERASLRGKELGEEVERASGGRVTLRPLSFSGLSVRESGGAGSGARGGASLAWSSIIGALFHGREAIAPAEIDRAIERGGADEATAAGSRLIEACRATAELPEEDARRGRSRLRGFVQSLRPETRRLIMEGCLAGNGGDGSAGDGTSGAGAEDVAALFDPGEMISVLDGLERAGTQLSPETMKLFRKLSALNLGPEERRAAAREAEQGDLASAGELLGQQDKAGFTPDDYASQLDACVSTKSRGEESDEEMLSRDAVLLHKAEIGLELLREPHETEDNSEGVFRFLGENLDRIIDARRLDLLVRGVRAARQRVYHTSSIEGESAAHELLAAIDDARRVTRILEAGAPDAEAARADLIELFREAEFLLARVPGVLVDNASPNVMTAGAEILLGVPESQLRPLAEALAATDLAALRVLLEILVSLPGSRLVGIIEPLLSHDDAPVRRLAYRALVSGGVQLRAEVLKRGLADEDHLVQRATLEHIRARRDAPSLDTLEAFLSGKLRSKTPATRHVYRLASEFMASAEPDGLRRACSVLLGLRPRFDRRSAAYARELAEVIAERRDDPNAARALAGWWRSPARLVAALTGARLPSEGSGR